MSKQFGTNQATYVVVSDDLEKTLLRLIHGTRIEGHPPELQQKNFLSNTDVISKRHESQWLRRLYDFLCEIAHPNVIGNARYWSNVESTDLDGVKM